MPIGNFTTGNGTITTFTNNANVNGSGTTFVVDFKPGSVIANVSNVFIGYVGYITSNTNLVLRSNANLAVSNSAFHVAAYTANVANVVYNCIGNINASTTTNMVFGNNTAFISNLSYGDAVIVPNLQSTIDNYLGTVEMVIDNNTFMLSANSYANIADSVFYKKSQNYFSTTEYGASYSEFPINAKLNIINSNLYTWSTTGLIPGTSFVNKYHPPIPDSVTGLLVDLPSSTFTNISQAPILSNLGEFVGNTISVSIFSNANTLNSYQLGISGITLSGQSYNVTDFDSEHRAFGTDISYVHNSLYNADTVKNLVNNSQNYTQNQSAIIPNSHVHQFANAIGAIIPRVTDSYSDLVEYFSQVGPTTQLAQDNNTNLGQNQDNNLRIPPIQLKKMSASGVPIAVPGILNVKIESDEPTDITYKPLNYKVIK
jgi:hypothetical protein